MVLRHRLSVDQAASYLGRCRETLYNWRRNKVGPPFYKEIGRVYYLRSDLDEWRERFRSEG